VLVVAVPPIALVMRKPPTELPAIEHGALGTPRDLAGELERSLTVHEAMRDRDFWLITVAFALTVMGLSALLLHQIPLLMDLGVPAPRAALSLAAIAGVGVAGKLGFGALLDRFDQRRVIITCFLLQAAGMSLLPAVRHPAILGLYVLVYGYAMGGNATLQATIIGECFGRLHYGAIAGRMALFIVVAQAAAMPVVGALRDRTGSYALAVVLITALTLVAALCIAGLRKPVRQATHRRDRSSIAQSSHSGSAGVSSV
jgi:predicted MFS family arabinose efflux permease